MSARRLLALALLVAIPACHRDSRTTLTVYSPHGKELLEYYEQAFEKAHPDVDVQWVDLGSQDVLDRLRSEKDNPQADVWFGAPAETFNHAAAEGLLDPYVPSWANAVDPAAHDARNLWYGTYLTPEVIAYNTQQVSAADAPGDWDEVLAPKWKGRIVIRDPVSSGSMRAIFAAILERSIDRTGSTAQGWDWLRRLDASTKEYVINPTMLYQKLGQGEGLVSLWDMPDIAVLQQRTKYPIAYRIPSSGTPLLVDGIAVVHGAKHPELARAYYEFVTSRSALETAARQFLRIPARTDIPLDSLPDWIRQARAQIKPMPLDHKLVADSIDAWMQKWDASVRNCCRGK